jgi:hypothetical protein
MRLGEWADYDLRAMDTAEDWDNFAFFDGCLWIVDQERDRWIEDTRE